jgi:hypothetical protein
MDLSVFKKAKIKSCSDSGYWYKDQIGKTIYVKELGLESSFLEDKQGRNVFKFDIEYITKK